MKDNSKKIDDSNQEAPENDKKSNSRFSTYALLVVGAGMIVAGVSTGGLGFLVGLGVAAVVGGGAIAAIEFYEDNNQNSEKKQITPKSFTDKSSPEKSLSQDLEDRISKEKSNSKAMQQQYLNAYPLDVALSNATGISEQDIIPTEDKGNCFYLALDASGKVISSKDLIIGHLLEKKWTDLDYLNVENAEAKKNEYGELRDKDGPIFNFSGSTTNEEKKERAIEYYTQDKNYADSLTITNAADAIGKNIMIFKPGVAESVQIILANPTTEECCPIYYHSNKLHYSALQRSTNLNSLCAKILQDARTNGADNPYGYAIDLEKLSAISKPPSPHHVDNVGPIKPDPSPPSDPSKIQQQGRGGI